MRNHGGKKLSLSKETLRGLSQAQLALAGGARPNASFTGTCDTCGNCVPSPGTQTCITRCDCSAICV